MAGGLENPAEMKSNIIIIIVVALYLTTNWTGHIYIY